MDQDISGQRVTIHRASVRVFHWLNVVAMLIMIPSGWQIYNATVFWNEDYPFPDAITLGGWLGGALQWHFAAMWLLVVNLLVYLLAGLVSGHFRRSFLPVTPRTVLQDFGKAVHDHPRPLAKRARSANPGPEFDHQKKS